MHGGPSLAYGAVMKRIPVLWLALALALPMSRAHAQTAGTTGSTTSTTSTALMGNIGFTLKKAGDADYKDTTLATPIGGPACKQGTITVDLSAIPIGTRYISVYLNTGQTQCNDQLRGESPSVAACELLLPPKDISSMPTNYAGLVVPLGDTCAADGARNLWFLATGGTASSEDTQNFVSVQLQVDTTAPPDVTNVSGGSGETAIPVTWTQSTDLKPLTYWTVIDTHAQSGAADGGDMGCSSQLLVPGTAFDPNQKPLPDGIIVNFIDSPASSATFDGSSWGTSLASIGVLAVDIAGNYSNVSNLGCLEVVPTVGFWDKYKADGGSAESGCGCAIVGIHRLHAASGGGLCVLGLVGALRMRRRARRRA
jgi:hypothetical protein